MFYYLRLLQQFPFTILLNGGVGGFEPPTLSRVITKRGSYVITARGNLTAKQY